MRKFFLLLAIGFTLIAGFFTLNYFKESPISKTQLPQTSISKTKNIMRTPISWSKPSETVPYPDLNTIKNFWIRVSLKKNRTYLMSGSKIIYTMYSSGGVFVKDKNDNYKSVTPVGTFYVEKERGNTFFNPSLNEGANYWTSWLNHGEYLFHSVPTNRNGNYNLIEAQKLGEEPASHGCIRLSISDAKWIHDNLKVGTKVVINNN